MSQVYKYPIKDGGPAFPHSEEIYDCGERLCTHYEYGMTLRDYFAAAALQGLLAYSYCSPTSGNWQENSSQFDVARVAYRYADAMLLEREAPQ